MRYVKNGRKFADKETAENVLQDIRSSKEKRCVVFMPLGWDGGSLKGEMANRAYTTPDIRVFLADGMDFKHGIAGGSLSVRKDESDKYNYDSGEFILSAKFDGEEYEAVELNGTQSAFESLLGNLTPDIDGRLPESVRSHLWEKLKEQTYGLKNRSITSDRSRSLLSDANTMCALTSTNMNRGYVASQAAVPNIEKIREKYQKKNVATKVETLSSDADVYVNKDFKEGFDLMKQRAGEMCSNIVDRMRNRVRENKYPKQKKPSRYVRCKTQGDNGEFNCVAEYDDKFRSANPLMETTAMVYDNIQSNLDWTPELTEKVCTIVDGDDISHIVENRNNGDFEKPANTTGKEAVSNMKEVFASSQDEERTIKKKLSAVEEDEIVENFAKLVDEISRCENVYERFDRTVLALNDNEEIVNDIFMSTKAIRKVFMKQMDEFSDSQPELSNFVLNTTGKLLNQCEELRDVAVKAIDDNPDITVGEVKEIQKQTKRASLRLLGQLPQNQRAFNLVKDMVAGFDIKDVPKIACVGASILAARVTVEMQNAAFRITSDAYSTLNEITQAHDAGVLGLNENTYIAQKAYYASVGAFASRWVDNLDFQFRGDIIGRSADPEIEKGVKEVFNDIGKRDYNKTKDPEMSSDMSILKRLEVTLERMQQSQKENMNKLAGQTAYFEELGGNDNLLSKEKQGEIKKEITKKTSKAITSKILSAMKKKPDNAPKNSLNNQKM